MTSVRFKQLPFDTNNKVFTDLQSIAFLHRLLGAFSIGTPEYIYDEDDLEPPIAVREKLGFKLPHVQAIIPSDEVHSTASKLANNEHVVAVLYNEAMNGNLEDGQWLIVAIFDTVQAAYDFVGYK